MRATAAHVPISARPSAAAVPQNPRVFLEMDFVRHLRFAALFGFCLFTSVEARADLSIATPSGLSLGDQFRIVFLTNDVTQATNSAIGYYNTFVNNNAISQAGGGGNNVVYGSTVLTWTAIASTYEVSAISNIGSFGVPVYTASGTLITPSDTATGLWSGTLLAPINQFLTSPSFFDTGVWTGTLQSGTAAGSFTLGSDSEFGSIPGLSNKTDAEWVSTGAVPSSFTNNMYGISQVLTAVPEPSTYTMALAGIACGGYSMWRRRKRASFARAKNPTRGEEVAITGLLPSVFYRPVS